MDTLERALTAGDVAERLSLAKSTVYLFANRGDLPAFKIGHALRFSPSDVQAFVDKRKAIAIGKK